jgi:hypothetical protein
METVKLLIRFIGLLFSDLLQTIRSKSSGNAAILLKEPLYRCHPHAVIPHPQVDFTLEVFSSFR